MKKTPEQHLDELRHMASLRGGKLISDEWIKNTTKYEFEDILGNRFFISGGNAKFGKWKRGEMIIESLCRQIFEYLYGDCFPSTKKILTAELLKRSHSLELDGYNDDLKVAFGYQGYRSHWDKKHKNYSETVARDQLKPKFCKQLNIDLIIIDIFNFKGIRDVYKGIFEHVLNSIKSYYLTNNKVMPILNLNDYKVDLSKNSYNYKNLIKLKEIAEVNQGKLISNNYFGYEALHIFQFSDGREFKISPKLLKQNGWPKDPDYFLKTPESLFKDFKSFIEANGATLINTEWKGVKYKYKIQLATGEFFYSHPHNLKTSLWPKAGDYKVKTEKELLNELKIIAKKNKGKLLSNKWINNTHKYEFQFESGEKFNISAEKLKYRGWPKNSKFYLNRLKTDDERYQELREIAFNNDGEIITEKWIPNNYKFEFKFKDGRSFFTKYSTIINLGWPKKPDEYFRRTNGFQKRKK